MYFILLVTISVFSQILYVLLYTDRPLRSAATSARPPPRPAEQSGKIKSNRNSRSLEPHWDTVCNTVTLTSNKTECLVALEEAVDLEVGKEAVVEEGGVVALGVGTAAAAEEVAAELMDEAVEAVAKDVGVRLLPTTSPKDADTVARPTLLRTSPSSQTS